MVAMPIAGAHERLSEAVGKVCVEKLTTSGCDAEGCEGERSRRIAAMESSAAGFAAWVAPGITHPASASDLYATRPAMP